jgi:hypothetical protein
MTHRAKVAQRKEIAIRRNHTRDKIERGTKRLWALRKSLWTRQEGRTGSKGLSGRSYVESRNIKAPLRSGKRNSVRVRRVGYGGAPATPGVIVPLVRVRKRIRETM